MANLKTIRKKIQSSPKVLRETKKIVKKKFEEEKNILLSNFELHPVTQEIMGGPEASNISNTLMGYGNLFTFIGFNESSSPLSPVRQYLKAITRIKSIRKGSGGNIVINISVPDLNDFRKSSPLPWEPGRSWIEGIERGISGFGYYINSSRSNSRSGKGVQVDNKVRAMAFKNTKYMSELIRNFTKRVRRLK